MNLCSDYIKKYSIENGIDFVGIASPDRFKGAPGGHHPVDLLKTVQSIIVCGLAVPSASLMVPGTLYHKVIEMIHLQLEQAAMKIAQEIEKKGGMAIPVSTHAPYYYWNEEEQFGRGDLSHKHAAEAAGLGKIGKSSIFISRDYGILTRLISILTDVELSPDPLPDWEPCPEECTLCIDACPVKAIKSGFICEQALCRTNIFKKTLKGTLYEDCRECLKACPWVLKRIDSTEHKKKFEASSVGNIAKQNNIKEKIAIATLGPSGTCSEYAAQFYINTNNYDGRIDLYSTFEESIVALKNSKSDLVIIPSAYQNFAQIIFKEKEEVELSDVFKLTTPNLVIASKKIERGQEHQIQKIATHPSPSTMAMEYLPGAQFVITRSNSESANLLLSDDVDACLTTIVCARKNSLNIIHNFGSIPMGWNVLRKKELRKKKD